MVLSGKSSGKGTAAKPAREMARSPVGWPANKKAASGALSLQS
jgi:hypothetical protein